MVLKVRSRCCRGGSALDASIYCTPRLPREVLGSAVEKGSGLCVVNIRQYSRQHCGAIRQHCGAIDQVYSDHWSAVYSSKFDFEVSTSDYSRTKWLTRDLFLSRRLEKRVYPSSFVLFIANNCELFFYGYICIFQFRMRLHSIVKRVEGVATRMSVWQSPCRAALWIVS